MKKLSRKFCPGKVYPVFYRAYSPGNILRQVPAGFPLEISTQDRRGNCIDITYMFKGRTITKVNARIRTHKKKFLFFTQEDIVINLNGYYIIAEA